MARQWFITCFLFIGLLLTTGASSVDGAQAPRKIRKVKDTKRSFAYAEKSGIKYELYKVSLGIPDALEENNFTWSIEFPSLTQAQYEDLMSRFGGQSLVSYAAGRRYTLVDFLHPKIQALVNRTMEQNYCEFTLPKGWRNPMRPTEAEYETGMACWDAVYEILRNFREPFKDGVTEGRAFHIGAQIVEITLKNPAYFDAAAKQSLSFDAIRGAEAGKAERNRGRQVGDVLLLDTMGNCGIGAAHAMLWLDDELYFEKPDMGTSDPFRIVFYQDGVKFWLSDVVLDQENRAQLAGTFYRYTKPLPDPFTFTDKWYFYDWAAGAYPAEMKPKGTLNAATAGKYIWNQDIGLGGGLSKFRINPVQRFRMSKDNNGRAMFVDADGTWMHPLF